MNNIFFTVVIFILILILAFVLFFSVFVWALRRFRIKKGQAELNLFIKQQISERGVTSHFPENKIGWIGWAMQKIWKWCLIIMCVGALSLILAFLIMVFLYLYL